MMNNTSHTLLNTTTHLQRVTSDMLQRVTSDMQNNDRKTVFDWLSFHFETFIHDLFALFTSLKQFIHLKWLLNILYPVSRSYLVTCMSSQIKHRIFNR